MSNTTNYNLNKPTYGTRNWDIPLNQNFDVIDSTMKSIDDKIGNLSNSTTTNKSSVVNITNEINSNLNSHLADMTKVFINVMAPPAPLIAAKGDGSTDDTTAINGIINYLKPTGGIMFFPPGIYKYDEMKIEYTGEDTIKPGIRIKGAGIEVTKLKPYGDYGVYIAGATKTNRTPDLGLVWGAGVEDLTIEGLGKTSGIGTGIYAIRYVQFILKNVLVKHMGLDGIFLDRKIFTNTVDEYSIICPMDNVHAFANGGYGFRLGSDHAVQQTTMVNCYSWSNEGGALWAYPVELSILGGWFGGNGNGILITKGSSPGINETPITITINGLALESNKNYSLKIDAGNVINCTGMRISSGDTNYMSTKGIILGTNSSNTVGNIKFTNCVLDFIFDNFIGIEIGQYLNNNEVVLDNVDINLSGVNTTKISNPYYKQISVRKGLVQEDYSNAFALWAEKEAQKIVWIALNGNVYMKNVPQGKYFANFDTNNHKISWMGDKFFMLDSGDFQVYGAGNGIILRTPDGSKFYKLTVSNTGTLTITQI